MEPNWLDDEASTSKKVRYRIRRFNEECGEWLAVLLPWFFALVFATGLVLLSIHIINKING